MTPMIVIPQYSEDGRHYGYRNSDRNVHNHDTIENLLKRAHLVDVLAEIHD